MPFLNTIGSASLLNFGLTNVYAGGSEGAVPSLYFFNAEDVNLWGSLSNWFSATDHATNAGVFPDYATRGVLLENTATPYTCEVTLDGYRETQGQQTIYHRWNQLDYWNPSPRDIRGTGGTGTATNLLFQSNTFHSLDTIPAFVSGIGSYAVGDVVEYPAGSEIYYEAIRIAENTTVNSNNVPAPQYWGYIGAAPYVRIDVRIDGDVDLEGVIAR